MLTPIRESYRSTYSPVETDVVASEPARERGFLTALVLSLLLLLTVWMPARAEEGQDYALQAGAQLIGRSVPPLIVTTVDGATLDLGALRGKKAIYLKFWATWCSTCREQMPHFEHVQQQAADDLQVVAIDIGFDDTVEQIKAYRRETGLTMPIVLDDDGKLAQLFGLRVTPQHVIIGKDGRIAYMGHLADAKLDAALTAARSGKVAQAGLPETKRDTTAADDAAKLQIRTIDGQTLAISDLAQGRNTTLVFFSPWCEGYLAKTRPEASAQCRSMRERLQTTNDSEKQRWIGIALGIWTSDDDIRAFRDRYHIASPLALDADGNLFRRFGIHNVPVLVELDSRGNRLIVR